MGLGSVIRRKPIPDPGFRDQKGTGSRIRIRTTASTSTVCIMCITDYFFRVDLNQRLEDPEAKADFEKGMIVQWIRTLYSVFPIVCSLDSGGDIKQGSVFYRWLDPTSVSKLQQLMKEYVAFLPWSFLYKFSSSTLTGHLLFWCLVLAANNNAWIF